MSELKGKKLLILGGSRISCEIVRQAKKMGVYTMVTDWYPVEKSPAKQLADEYFMTSTADIEAMVKLVKDEKVDGIITGFTDSVLPHYAEICEKTNLPSYGTKEQFEKLTNKNIYKKICQEYNVPVIDEYPIMEEDLSSLIKYKIKYPVLVKPSDGSGGKGVYICNNEKELIESYKKALNFSEKKEILVERYVQGEEVTVFYLLEDGEVYLSGLGNRHVKHNQEAVIPLPVAYTFPSIHLEEYRERVEPQVKKMFKSLGMKNGMVFMQCLVQDNECLVYDIGYRLTGSLEYKILDEISGINPLEMLIRHALTGKMSEASINDRVNPDWKQYGCNVSFLVKPGVIDKINGLDKIKKIPGVIDAVLAKLEGDEVPNAAIGTLQQIVLRVFATTNNKEDLEIMLNEIYNSLEVISDKGESMLLDGFDTRQLEGALK